MTKSVVFKLCAVIFSLTCAVNSSVVLDLKQNNVIVSKLAINKATLNVALSANILSTNQPYSLTDFKEKFKNHQQTFRDRQKVLIPISPDSIDDDNGVDESNSSLSSNITSSETRIVGGVPATPHEFPWQAFLLIEYESGDYSACGGTLISQQWILTAAHCVTSEGGNIIASVLVLLGAHDVSDADEASQKTYEAATIIIHEDWDSNYLNADIALIQLSTYVSYTQHIRPIQLASSNEEDHVNDMVTVSGWGLQSDYSTDLSSTLRKATAPVISNSDCRKTYGSTVVTDGVICTSGVYNKGTCQGDSGGPMIYKQEDGSWIQVGITSFVSSKGCQKGLPHGFTRVSSYKSWVLSEVGSLPPPPPYSGSSQLLAHYLLTAVAIGLIILV